MNILKQKKVILAIVIVVLLFGSVALGYEMIIKNNPKNLYLLAEHKTYQQTVKELEEMYGDQWELQKKLLEQPSSSTSEVKMDFNLGDTIPGFGPIQQAMVKSILDSSKLVLNVEQDPVNRINFSTFSLNLSGNDLFAADIYKSQEQMGVQIPAIYDKYLYIENDQFGEMMRKVDPAYAGPESLNEWPDYREFYHLPKNMFEHISKGYSQFLIDTLKEEYITLTKGVPYESPEGTVDVRKIDIVMTEDEIREYITGFFDQLSQDELFLDIVTESAVEFMKIHSYSVDSYNEEDLTNPEYVRGKIEEGFAEIKGGLEKTRFPEGLTMTLLVNKQELIVDRSVRFAVTDENDAGATFSFSWNKWLEKNSNKTSSWVFEVQPISDTDVITFTLEAQTTSARENDGMKEEMFGSLVAVENGDTSVDVTLDLSTFKTQTGDGKNKVEYDFDLGFNGTEFEGEQPIINGKLTRIMDQDLKKNYSNQQLDFDVNVGMDSSYQGKQTINLIFNTTTNVQFKDKIDFPQFSEENGVNVATLSEQEMYMIGAEIERSIQEFILGNSSLLDF